MTVETTTNVAVLQTNGVSRIFPYSFKVFEEEHLSVLLREEGNERVVPQGTYTVTGLGQDSGSINMNIAPAAGQELVVMRVVPLTQELDIVNQGGFFPDTVEEQLDKTTMQIQQIGEISERTVKTLPGEKGITLPSIEYRAGKYLMFDENGDADTDTPENFAAPAREWAKKAAAASATAESAAGPTYSNIGEGISQTKIGQSFAVSNGDGTVTIYLHDEDDVAVAQRTLATTDALRDENGAELVGVTNRWGAPYLKTVSEIAITRKASPLFWVPEGIQGAVLDGSSASDLGGYIQNAIDALHNDFGGGTLDFPDGRYNGHVVLKSGVSLVAADSHPSATPNAAKRVVWHATGSGAIVDTPPQPASGTSIEGGAVKGFQFVGQGAAQGAMGIRVRSARKFFIKDCAFNELAFNAIKQDEPSGSVINGTLSIENCFAQNCMRDNAGLTDWEAVVDLRGTDSQVFWVESTGSLLEMSESGFVAAFLFGGADMKAVNVLGEFADANFVWKGANAVRFEGVNLTGDKSFGHNFLLDGAADCSIDGLAKRTGQQAHNTFDGVHCIGASQRNAVGVHVVDSPGTAIKARYGIYEDASTTNPNNKNDFSRSSVKSGAAATADYHNVSLFGGSPMPAMPVVTPVTGSEPDVNGLGAIRHSSGGTITNLLNGTAGQEVLIMFAGSGATIEHGGNFFLNPAETTHFPNNSFLHLKNYNGRWYAVGTYIKRQGGFPYPAGGSVVDQESRDAITSIMDALKASGILA